MNIKDKYRNELNNKMLSSEFKQNLAELMREKFEDEAVDETDEAVLISDEEECTPQIVHENKHELRILKYIAASAAVFAAVFSSVLFIRNNIPDQTVSKDPAYTSVTYIGTNSESSISHTLNQNAVLPVTTAAVSSRAITELTSAVSYSGFPVRTAEETKYSEQLSSHSSSEAEKKRNSASYTTPSLTVSEQITEVTTLPPVTETLPEETTEITEITEITDDNDGNGYLAFLVSHVEKKEDGLYDVYIGCSPDSTETVTNTMVDLEYDLEYLIIEEYRPVYNDYEVLISDKRFLYTSEDALNHDLSGKDLACYTFRIKDNAPKGRYEIKLFGQDPNTTHAVDDGFISLYPEYFSGYIVNE